MGLIRRPGSLQKKIGRFVAYKTTFMKKDFIIAMLALICLGLEVHNHFKNKRVMNSIIIKAYQAGWNDGAIANGANLNETKAAFAQDSLDFANFLFE